MGRNKKIQTFKALFSKRVHGKGGMILFSHDGGDVAQTGGHRKGRSQACRGRGKERVDTVRGYNHCSNVQAQVQGW